MNKEILKNSGFTKEVELVENSQCPICKKVIKLDNNKEFKDKLSIREFVISGLCQNCQDRAFK